MRSRIAVIILIILSAVALYAADQKEQAAQESAQKWLALNDGGKYAEAWSAAARVFKDHVTRPQWEEAMKSVRAPLGAVVARTLQNAKYTQQLPGAPQGDYVVIQYTTSFAQRKDAVETIVMQLDEGEWKTSGYFIK